MSETLRQANCISGKCAVEAWQVQESPCQDGQGFECQGEKSAPACCCQEMFNFGSGVIKGRFPVCV